METIIKKKETSSKVCEDIVWEILFRSPTKSLMRFKGVSKLWRSIICNPNFAVEHTSHGAFRGLLVANHLFFETPVPREVTFLYARLPEDNNADRRGWMDHQLTITPHSFDQLSHTVVTTEVVKGLIVMFGAVENTLKLCNIATKELLDLPTPSNCPPVNAEHYNPENVPYRYHLGFDHIHQVYKLLKLCDVYFVRDETVCQVMTLGGGDGSGGRWRVIDSAPPAYPIETRSLWIKDALYWLAPKSLDFASGKPGALIEFDLNTETFRSVPIPDCLKFKVDCLELAQIDGSPAVLFFPIVDGVYSKMNVWTLTKPDHRGSESAEMAWKKHITYFPKITEPDKFYMYTGTLPSGKMLIADVGHFDERQVNVYCYDHMKKKKEEDEVSLMIIIPGIRPFYTQQHAAVFWPSATVWYHQENIVPLRFLVGNQTECRFSVYRTKW